VVLRAFGEEQLVADPHALRQGEPGLLGQELLHGLEPAVGSADHGRRQLWDPSVSRQQTVLRLIGNYSAVLWEVCLSARADSSWLMDSRSR
jgi:hypothetical protein